MKNGFVKVLTVMALAVFIVLAGTLLNTSNFTAYAATTPTCDNVVSVANTIDDAHKSYYEDVNDATVYNYYTSAIFSEMLDGENNLLTYSGSYDYIGINSNYTVNNTTLYSSSTKKGPFIVNGSDVSLSVNGSDVLLVGGSSISKSTYLVTTFKLGEDLKNALKDKLVSVSIKPYLITGDPTGDMGDYFHYETANLCLDYYLSTSSGNNIYAGFKQNVTFNIARPEYISSDNERVIPSGTYGDDSFFQVSLRDFAVGGDCNVSIRAIGINLRVTYSDNIIISAEESTFEITGEGRHVDASEEYAATGNTLSFDLVINQGSNDLELDVNSYSSSPSIYTDGTYFRKLFLNTDDQGVGEVDEYIVNWKILSGSATLIRDASDKSGQRVSFEVISGGGVGNELTIQAAISYRNVTGTREKNAFCSHTFTVYVDNEFPNEPHLKENTFYDEYINNLKFYTASESEYGTENERKVNLFHESTTDDTKPYLMDSSYDLMGGCKTVVYYRTSYVGDTVPTMTIDRISTGFDPFKESDANNTTNNGVHVGILYEIEDGEVIIPSEEMLFDLYDTSGNLCVSGVWSIELFSCDYVGNSQFNPTKYFIRIDINDYEFTVNYVLGIVGGDDSMGIGPDNVTLSYVTILDSGKKSPTVYQVIEDTLTLRRETRVAIRVKFNSRANYQKYIFTEFSTKGMNVDCKNNTYSSSYETDVNCDVYVANENISVPFTFTVGDVFAKDETARYINFKFKNRVTINTANKEQFYNGLPKEVYSQVVGNNSVRVSVKYYVDEARTILVSENNANAPISAGRYYYVAEVVNNNYFYGVDMGELLVKKATPNISTLYSNISINYGQDMSSIDISSNELEEGEVRKPNEMLYAYVNGVYSSELSSDNVVGYYALSDNDRESSNYIRPDAGEYQITVVFYAVKGIISNNNVVYEYDENGEFIRNNNYELAQRTITLKVRHDENVIFNLNNGVEGQDYVETYYDGLPKDVNYKVLSGREDEKDLDLTNYTSRGYAEVSSMDITVDEMAELNFEKMTTLPLNAGVYAVRIKINENACNYKGTQYWFIVINKVELNVEIDEDTCSYDYQYEKIPNVMAKLGENDISSRLKFKYEFYYYDESQYDDLASAIFEENQVTAENEVKPFVGLPVNAGKYAVKVYVDDNNYQGESVALYTINVVNDDNIHKTITWPTLLTLGGDYHISYGQPLKAIKIDERFSVKYAYVVYVSATRTTTTTRTVDGSMLIVTEKYEDWKLSQPSGADVSRQAYVDYMNEYNGANFSVEGKEWYICFNANDSVNFDFLYQKVEVLVGKANVDWTKVKVDNVEYETDVQSVDDLSISKTAGILYSNTRLVPLNMVENEDYYVVGNYVYLYLSQEDYSYSLAVGSSGIYESGNVSIGIVLNHNDNINFNVAYEKDCQVVVDKKVLSMTFEANDYIATYKQLEESDFYNYISYSGNSLELPTLRGTFAYYLEGEEIVNNGSLPAGVYNVKYTINNTYNYTGTLDFNITIKKSKLHVKEFPKIIDEGNVAYYTNAYSNVVFTSGVMADENGDVVSGNFRVSSKHNDETFGFAGENATVYFDFIPTDTNDYEIFEGYSDSGFVVTVINRKDVSRLMSIEINGTYTYGEVNYTADDLKGDFIDTGILTYTLNKDNAEDLVLDLAWSLNVVSRNSDTIKDGPLNAGTYIITASIDKEYYDAGININANYKGSVSVEFTINKRNAYIVLSEVEHLYEYNDMTGIKKEYQGRALSIGVLAYADNDNVNPINEAIKIEYKRNDIDVGYTPSEIGYYDCYISFSNSINYTLVENANSDVKTPFIKTFLMIGVNIEQIKFINVTQIYTIQKLVSVDMGINDATCGIYYVDALGKTYSELPINAGTYSIHLTFEGIYNNGYVDDINFSDLNGNGEIGEIGETVLVINKYSASIMAPDTVTTVYSGINNVSFEAYTSPYGLKLNYSYTPYDTNENYQSIESAEELGALNAGKYYVLISIADNNYKGEKRIVYDVKKAPITVTVQPVFNDYVYNDVEAPTIKTDGTVYCNNDKKEVEGEFVIEVTDVNYLAVGVHEVNYTFYPNSDNYDVCKGNTLIVINKRELEDNFLFINTVDGKATGSKILENAVYAVEYDNEYHSVVVSYDKTALYSYATANNDFMVNVYYNGSTNRPRNKGSYEIKAVVSSRNYVCERTWEYNLELTQCTPHIKTSPNVNVDKVFGIGDTITTADISGGEAVIKTTGVRIDGTFTVTETTFTKANQNKVVATFTPINTTLYKVVNFNIQVKVLGTDTLTINGNKKPQGTTASDSDWTEVEGGYKASSCVITPTFIQTNGEVRIVIKPVNGESALSYGVELSQFEVAFVSADDTQESAELVELLGRSGTIEFVKEDDYVPNVGEKIEVIYKLTVGGVDNYELYNDMSGLISIDGILEKVELNGNNTTTEFIEIETGYILNVYQNGELTIGIDERNDVVKLDGAIIYTDTLEETITISITENNNNVDISVETKNYVYLNTVEIRNYILIEESDVLVGNDSKTYDGNPIEAKDLNVTVRNTQLTVTEDAISVKVYDMNGLLSDGIEIGKYTVIIYVNDRANYYYGNKTVTFEITKRDVSAELELEKDTDEYNSATVNNVSVKWNDETLSIYEYSIEYKKQEEADSEYSSNVIFSAGVYDVRVTVNTDEITGVAVLTYTVKPKSVTMVKAQDDFVYTYGNSYGAPSISFIETDTKTPIALEYVIQYHSSEYTVSEVLPTEASVYTAKVILANTNYALESNSFTFTVNPKSVTVVSAPKALFTIDENGTYNLKYGQKLSEVRLDDSGRVTSSDILVEGVFAISDSDKNKVLVAGTHSVDVVFTPNSKNYATATVKVEIVIAKALASVTFTSLSATYNGLSRASEIKYVITPRDIDIKIEYKGSSGAYTTDPVNAGNYELRVTSNNANYNVKINLTQSETMPLFIIYKTQYSRVLEPIASAITVGESLSKSALSNGIAYYHGFNNNIKGTFEYVQNSLVFTTAGYKEVEYKFVPTDGVNFAPFTGSVIVKVNKGIATIDVESNVIEYGTVADFNSLVFVTQPSHLANKVVCDTTYKGVKYANGQILNAGTYYFTCYIEDDNYTSEVKEFAFVVNKKVIDIDFIDADGNVVTAYTKRYGQEINVKVKMYDANHTGDKRTYLMKDADSIYKTLIYQYNSRTGAYYESFVAPTDVESYDITVNLVHDNYVASRTIIYKITKGIVENIEFDQETLMNQTYGKVVAPIVRTTPANVNYYIVYQGYNLVLPTNAGTYNITVYIDDENYETTQIGAVFKINKKELSISDIKVNNKVYDGTPTLEISGRLAGLLYEDEVELTMTATTYNKDAGIGEHYVDITTYAINGLQADNYQLSPPIYNDKITIYNNKVYASGGNSYVLSTEKGFISGTQVAFNKLDLKANATNVFSKMLGVEAKAIGYEITVNGNSALNADQYKICIEIPKEYLNVEFDVEFDGALLGQNISYVREGNYVSFYASSSTGTVVFTKAEFDYTYVVILASLIIILIAIVVVLILNPLQNRKKVSSKDAEKRAIREIRNDKKNRR